MSSLGKHVKNVSVLSAGIVMTGLLSGCFINIHPNDTATTSPAESNGATTQDTGPATTSPTVDCSKSALERSIEKVPIAISVKNRGSSGFFKSRVTETAALAIDFVSPVPIP